jgi:hypothetical protein
MIIIFTYLHSYLCINLMKMCLSRPSSKKHCTHKEIMFRETKVSYD